MSYGRRRRIADAAGALAAVALTAAGAWALGGHAPDPATQGSASAAPPATRTVPRTITVRRTVHAVVAAPAPAPALAAPGEPALPAARRVAPGRPAPRRRAAPHRPAPKRPAAPAPASATVPPGGYRAFAAATAAMAGDLVVARAGSGAALDGHPLDLADELGPLADLPAGRTAFGRAIALPGGAAATSSSPPAQPAPPQGAGAATTARTGRQGACVLDGPISSAEANAATTAAGPIALAGGHSRTESRLDRAGSRYALVSRATVTPPEVSVGEVSVRFLGPVTLLARAGGTPGSAAVELGPRGNEAAAPLVEVDAGPSTFRYTAADVLDGGGRTLRAGPVTLVLGGAPHAWRAAPDAPPLVGAGGTFASAAADVLSVRLSDGQTIALGHLEVSAAVPDGGVACR